MPLKKEQLLAEVEDLLRNAPPMSEILDNQANGIAWFGRFSAVIHAWDYTRGPEVFLGQQQLESINAFANSNGYPTTHPNESKPAMIHHCLRLKL